MAVVLGRQVRGEKGVAPDVGALVVALVGALVGALVLGLLVVAEAFTKKNTTPVFVVRGSVVVPFEVKLHMLHDTWPPPPGVRTTTDMAMEDQPAPFRDWLYPASLPVFEIIAAYTV